MVIRYGGMKLILEEDKIMKARMKNNLITRYQLCPEFNYSDHYSHGRPPNELLGAKYEWGMESYFRTKEFLKRIEGEVVDLVFTAGDAFEKEDNNHWLPDSLWEPVEV